MTTLSVRARMRVILLSLITIGSELSYAADDRWRYFATNGLGDTLYYDTDSVTVYGNKIVKVWYKIILHKDSESPVREGKFLDEFNCNKRECRAIERHYYYKDGNHKFDVEKSNWEDIQPETWEESLFNIVCKKK
jgi:hypothetical protein